MVKLSILYKTPDILVLRDVKANHISVIYSDGKYIAGYMNGTNAVEYFGSHAYGYWRVWKNKLEFREVDKYRSHYEEYGISMIGERWCMWPWGDWMKHNAVGTEVYTRFVQEWIAEREIMRILAAGSQ